MIADTAVLSTSPWQGDQFLFPGSYTQDPDVTEPSHHFDMDIAALQAEIDRVKCESESVDMKQMTSSLMENSRGTSVASSECSDELYLDIDGESDTLFPSYTQGYLGTNSILSMLDSTVTSESSMSLGAFEWSDPEPHSSPFVDIESEPELPFSRDLKPPVMAKKRTHSETISDNRPWSSLQSWEQLAMIEELTDIISTQMGLREQLEIIRIINPHAAVSPHDTEFVIELESLSDEKLQRIREYVKQHKTDGSSSGSCISCNNNSSAKCHPKPQKKLTKKQRMAQQREERQRQRKEQRQVNKEKKSGLFHQEEVLSLTQLHSNDEEDDDIDILT